MYNSEIQGNNFHSEITSTFLKKQKLTHWGKLEIFSCKTSLSLYNIYIYKYILILRRILSRLYGQTQYFLFCFWPWEQLAKTLETEHD